MFQFANPTYLYALLVIPFLILVFIISVWQKQKALKNFGQPALIAGLMPEASIIRPRVKFIFMQIIIALLIIALAGPQFGTKLKEVKREGIELVIALDVSNSMMAEDIQPNRLENAKRAISKLIDRLHNDKIALIVFAGDAYVQLPMTNDYSAAKMFLNTISPKLMPRQGTAIGAAIDLGIKSFTPGDEKNKALIIITDGENHEDNPVEMAEKANKMGIIIHTIGMGLSKGAPIPTINKNGQKDYWTDNQGNVVITKLDELTLQKVAVSGGGEYIRANNTKTGLNTLFDKLEKMDKVAMDTKVYSDYEEQFQFFLGFALLFLLIEFMVLPKKNKLFMNINIFKTNLLNIKNK